MALCFLMDIPNPAFSLELLCYHPETCRYSAVVQFDLPEVGASNLVQPNHKMYRNTLLRLITDLCEPAHVTTETTYSQAGNQAALWVQSAGVLRQQIRRQSKPECCVFDVCLLQLLFFTTSISSQNIT